MYYLVETAKKEYEIRECKSLVPFNIQSLKEKILTNEAKEKALGEYFKKTEVYSYGTHLGDYVKTGKIEFLHGTTFYHIQNMDGKHDMISANGYHDENDSSIIWHLGIENSCGFINKSCYYLDYDEYGRYASDSVVMHIVRNIPILEESAFEFKNVDKLDWYMNDYMQKKFKSHLPLLNKFLEKARVKLVDEQILKYQKMIEDFNNLKNQSLDIKFGPVKVRT